MKLFLKTSKVVVVAADNALLFIPANSPYKHRAYLLITVIWSNSFDISIASLIMSSG